MKSQTRLMSTVKWKVRRVLGTLFPAKLTTIDRRQLQMVRRIRKEEEFRVELPAGYALRAIEERDIAAWLQLLNSARDFGYIDLASLEREVISRMLPDGGLIIEADGCAVACGSVCDIAEFRPYAALMFIMVKSGHRGKHLGLAIDQSLLRAAARAGFETVILNTDDDRLQAISQYLQIGFIPEVDASPLADKRWCDIFRHLRIQAPPTATAPLD